MNYRPHSGTSNGESPRSIHWYALAVLVVAIALAYRNIHLNGFHFDDWPNIIENKALHLTEFSLAGLLAAAQGAFLALRPLASATFAIDWFRGGGAASTFLVTNLAIHVLTACAVYLLIIRGLTIKTGKLTPLLAIASVTGALWWAAQPIHVQAVSYIVQRMTGLAAGFAILAVWSWVKARTASHNRLPWFLMSGCALVLGALAKENAWITPFLILMAELLVLRHQQPMLSSTLDRTLLSIPLLCAAVVMADLAMDGPLSRFALAGYQLRDFTLVERLLTQPKVIVFHVSQLLWPMPERFSIEHDVPLIRTVIEWRFWLPLAVILTWTAIGATLAARPALRLYGFFMLWVPATLLIESSIVPLELIFEHRMYLPTVGFAGLLALLVVDAHQRKPALAHALIGLITAHTLLALWSTQQRIPHWRSDVTLYEEAVRVAPNSPRAWNHLGIALLEKHRNAPLAPDRHRLAIAAFDRAISINPEHASAWANRGAARYFDGDHDQALVDLRRAIALNSRQVAAQHYLGQIYTRSGLLEDARIARKRACALGSKIDCNH